MRTGIRVTYYVNYEKYSQSIVDADLAATPRELRMMRQEVRDEVKVKSVWKNNHLNKIFRADALDNYQLC